MTADVRSDRAAGQGCVLYLLPFTYFARTRLANGHIAFHAVFEWGAALLLVSLFGVHGVGSIWSAVMIYLAFISVYELGYVYNDLVAARRESHPRLRGPQGASRGWIAAWTALRLATFGVVTASLGMAERGSWWLFFGALAIVLALHNLLHDKAVRSATFLWLAWFRFVAPVIFLLVPSQRMGILFGGGMIYATFRLFGYLDSKGVLALPRRRNIGFRAGFFLLPVLAAVATAGVPEAVGLQVLVLYFAAMALAGVAIRKLAPMMLGKRHRADGAPAR